MMGPLTTREAATVIWIAVVFIFALTKADIRSSIADILKQIVNPKILLIIFAFWGWVALAVSTAAWIGFWNLGMLKDAIFWLAFSGIGVFFSIIDVTKEEHFFRKSLLGAVGISAFMEFWLNEVHTFPIPVELALVPITVLTASLSVFTKGKPGHKFFEGLLIAQGVLILLFTTKGVIQDWAAIPWSSVGKTFIFSIWMPIAVLPVVYALAYVMTYGKLWTLTKVRGNEDRQLRFRSRIAALLVLGGNLRAVDEFSRDAKESRNLLYADTYTAARAIVKNFKIKWIHAQDDHEIQKARLDWYAGVKGTREDGTQLDRREFKATRDALFKLHGAQMGWHNNDARYRSDLLDLFPTFQDLPEPHCIKMTVRADGQAWIAWRETITGSVFGIGAVGPTPSRWYYFDQRPPTGFPIEDRSWADDLTEPTPLEWRVAD